MRGMLFATLQYLYQVSNYELNFTQSTHPNIECLLCPDRTKESEGHVWAGVSGLHLNKSTWAIQLLC